MTRTDSGQLSTMLNKVPEVTVYFWIIKVMATTVGETAADLESGRFRNPRERSRRRPFEIAWAF